MNYVKKIFAFLLLFCIALPVASFADVKDDYYVENLTEKGIIKGYSHFFVIFSHLFFLTA